MNQGRIIVITGAPGTGKTTTASVVAKESDLEKSVHMHTDDFYHYLSKGAKQNNQTTTSNFPCNFNFAVSNMNRFNQGIDHG